MTAEDSPTLRSALEAELRRLREETPVGRRMTAIEVLLAENGTLPTPTMALPQRAAEPVPAAPPVRRRGPGVSQAKLHAVRQYMEAKGEARQVDISNDLEENSGSVLSLALRALEAEGVVEPGDIESKSKVWRFIGEPSQPPDAKRATVIDIGNEVTINLYLEALKPAPKPAS